MDRLIDGLMQKTDFAFKSLREGECILEARVRRLLEDLLQRDKALFLERYARFMDQEELSLFSEYAGISNAFTLQSMWSLIARCTIADDYEVRWHLSQHLNAAPPSAKAIRNRRYPLQQ
jgi:hypothetical protein